MNPFLTNSAGPAKRDWSLFSSAPDHGATCEFCGTEWEQGIIITMGQLLDRQIVKECCGKFVDTLYEDLRESFAREALHDLARNPTSPTAAYLLIVLENALANAASTLAETQEAVAKVKAASTNLKE